MGKTRVPQYATAVRLAGKRLHLRREESGHGLRFIAERTGIGLATLSRIENGLQREMSVGNFFALCEALDLDPLRAWYGDARRAPAHESSLPPPASSQRPSKRPPK